MARQDLLAARMGTRAQLTASTAPYEKGEFGYITDEDVFLVAKEDGPANSIEFLELSSTLFATDSEIQAGTENGMRVVSPAQLNLAAQVHGYIGGLQETLFSATTTGAVTSKLIIGEFAASDAPSNVEHVSFGRAVKIVGSRAFEEHSTLKSVTIPNTVVELANDCFYFTQLESLTIPDSVISIGNFAFAASAISSAIIGKGVATMGDEVFLDCGNLADLTANITKTAFDTGSALLGTAGAITLRVPAGDTTWDTLANATQPVNYQGNAAVTIARI